MAKPNTKEHSESEEKKENLGDTSQTKTLKPATATTSKPTSQKSTQGKKKKKPLLSLGKASLLMLQEDLKNLQKAYPDRIQVHNANQDGKKVVIILDSFQVKNGEIKDVQVSK